MHTKTLLQTSGTVQEVRLTCFNKGIQETKEIQGQVIVDTQNKQNTRVGCFSYANRMKHLSRVF